MANKIDRDYSRFRKIVKGKVREELKQFISKGELVARKRGGKVTIPLPQIDIPRFRFGSQQKGGVGQGSGNEGDPVAGDGEKQPGSGEAGEDPGEHEIEVEVTLEELAKIFGEELGLPKIEPKGKKNVEAKSARYTGIRRTGPEGLRHFKRTYREGLKRAIAMGLYDPEDPIIIPEREDRRYRGQRETVVPESNAVLIYMMDVSGSMGEEQKEMVRNAAFWIDTWLRSQYKQIESVYIVHDAQAREVDEYTFYHLRESGGTKISSAYELCQRVIEERYNPMDWNIYPFHFSDGDNWGSDDSRICFRILEDFIFPASNQFCYGQVRSAYGSGKFKEDLDQAFPTEDKMITYDIHKKEELLDAIKAFLTTGR